VHTLTFVKHVLMYMTCVLFACVYDVFHAATAESPLLSFIIIIII